MWPHTIIYETFLCICSQGHIDTCRNWVASNQRQRCWRGHWEQIVLCCQHGRPDSSSKCVLLKESSHVFCLAGCHPACLCVGRNALQTEKCAAGLYWLLPHLVWPLPLLDQIKPNRPISQVADKLFVFRLHPYTYDSHVSKEFMFWTLLIHSGFHLNKLRGK